MNNSKGYVYWLTGLSGAGKTTIGKRLFQHLKLMKSNIVMLDGDTLREVFGSDLGYSKEDRFKSAMRNARLCKLLSDQGIDVICATISMFDYCRQWNRENIENYKEIYIKVSIEDLKKRNQKKLYSSENNDMTNYNVVGIDIEFEEPKNPDVTICNNNVIDLDDKICEIVKIILK